MTERERKQKIAYGYKIAAGSAVHKEYKERLMLIKGWTAQRISATLRKVVEYIIDHPEADFGRVYAGAFGLTINGRIVKNVIQ